MLQKHSLTSLIKLTLCAVVAGFAVQSQAADAKADGTWSWTQAGRNGGADRKMTLTLKTDGDKLTGTLAMPGRGGGDPVETKIEDGKVKGDEISFTVTREFNGNKMVMKYNGKVTADTIKGKSEMERNGEPVSRDWEAKREADKK